MEGRGCDPTRAGGDRNRLRSSTLRLAGLTAALAIVCCCAQHPLNGQCPLRQDGYWRIGDGVIDWTSAAGGLRPIGADLTRPSDIER
ncbi:Gamma-aminobutyric acid receptor [Trichinella pseudospiralis]|uniref:Uncharacterized protein n=1 Tax=Trichinella pseudospiralis TaxID=6337 RepID=A0A0V1FJF6_TRIPS|nr:hypothetical protein T4D_15235 [Trichinella pseudospiralis]